MRVRRVALAIVLVAIVPVQATLASDSPRAVNAQMRDFPARGLPGPITVGPDGNLWFTAFGGEIHRLTPGGVNRTVRVRTRDITSSGAIVAGSDGALWFTVPGGEQLGRISTQGGVRLFAVPRVDGMRATNVGGIVQGFDGDIWFTAERCCGRRLAGTIGRVTSQGRIIQYPVRDARITPTEITRGPGRQLWFGGGSADYIGSVTLRGRMLIHRLRAPVPGSLLAQGHDGALWSLGGGGLRRITAGGSVRAYSYDFGEGRTPLALAPGYTDRVWFANSDLSYEDTDAQVGFITARGQIAAMRLGEGQGLPDGMTAAPDGSMWVSQFQAQVVTRVALRGRAPTHSTGSVALARATARGRHLRVVLACRGAPGLFCQGRVTSVAVGNVKMRPGRSFTIAAGTRLRESFTTPRSSSRAVAGQRAVVIATVRDPAGESHIQRSASRLSSP